MPARKKTPAAKAANKPKAATKPKKPRQRKPAAKKTKTTRARKTMDRRQALAIIEPSDELVEVVLPRWDGNRAVETKTTRSYKAESEKAYQAFVDYCMLGPTRSLQKLHDLYLEQTQLIKLKKEKKAAMAKGVDIPEKAPPTTRLSTLKEWSASFNWGKRVKTFDQFYVREQLRYFRASLMQNVETQMGLVNLSFKIVRMGMKDLVATYLDTGKFPAPFRDVVRLFDLSLKHYRLSLGLSTENIELGISPEGGLREETDLDVTNQELEIIMAALTDALHFEQAPEPEDEHDYSQYSKDE